MNKKSRVYVAGHTGLAGSAILRRLQSDGYENIITSGSRITDLRSTEDTEKLFGYHAPEYVFFCAAKVGGIQYAIENPATLMADNLMMQTNIIDMCKRFKCKLLNIASSCIYPVNGKQPYKEGQIGEGKTDENWSYAVAKIAGVEMCKAYHKQYGSNFITAVPCNLYGPHDNFSGEDSHVIPALLKKMHEAFDNIELWGDGTPEREFLYSDDFADAVVFLMETVDYEDIDGVVNVGTGESVSIKTLLSHICNIADKNHVYPHWNSSRPNGVPSKLMDSSKIHKLGWKHKVGIREGLEKTFEWYIENRASDKPVQSAAG